MEKKIKTSICLLAETVEEVQATAEKLERSSNWVLMRAWQIAKEEIRRMPIAGTLPSNERSHEAQAGNDHSDNLPN